MDKPFTKTVFAAGGLPQLPYVTVLPWQWGRERDRVEARIRALGLPVFVKPARGGSSIGITRVSVADDLEPAIEAARAHDPKVLVEAAVDGIEVECAVLEGIDGGPPEASVPGQPAMMTASSPEMSMPSSSAFVDATVSRRPLRSADSSRRRSSGRYPPR